MTSTMHRPTVLQVRAKGASLAHAQELLGPSVRIGRGPLCEVRIDDPALADVHCLLRRRGDSWHVQPVGPPGRISLEGRPVETQCPLPLGETLTIGDHEIVLDRPVTITFGPPPTPEQPRFARVFARPDAPEPAAPPPTPPTIDRWSAARRAEMKWEARWRAAGAGLKARPNATPPRPEGFGATTLASPSYPTGYPNAAVPPPRNTFPKVAAIVPKAAPRPEPEPPATPPSPPAVVLETPADPMPTLTDLPMLEAWVLEREAPEPATPPEASDPPPPASPPRPVPMIRIEFDDPGTRLRRLVQSALKRRTRPAPPPAGPSEPITEHDEPIAETLVESNSHEGPATAPAEEPVEVELATPAEPESPSEDRVAPEPETSPVIEAAAIPEPLEEELTVLETQTSPVIEAATVPEPPSEVPPPPRGASEWPSARLIIASARRPDAGLISTSSQSLPTPTVARPPSQWRLPWLPFVWLLALGATLSVGPGACWLALAWAEDDMTAGALADLMVRGEEAGPREQELALAPGRVVATNAWWDRTSESLWLRAWAIDRPDADDAPARAEQVRAWLDAARVASPSAPTVRHALASRAGPGDRDRPETWPIGLSHDVLTRALAGRRLLAEGRTKAARMAYREAMDMACRAPVAAVAPVFDEKGTRRFRLPNEDLLAAVVADLVERPDWDDEACAETLPNHALAALAVFRAMKERRPLDADRLIPRIDRQTSPDQVPASPWHLAARAEALALRDRNTDALAAYEEALTAAPAGPSRRLLRYNLAEIAHRLGDDARARDALTPDTGETFDDAIGRRALRFLAELDRNRRGAAAPGLGVVSNR